MKPYISLTEDPAADRVAIAELRNEGRLVGGNGERFRFVTRAEA